MPIDVETVEKSVEKTGKCLVEVDPRYFRPTEVDLLLGDPRKARKKLGWKHTTPFKAMVREMVAADLKIVAAESLRFDRND